MKKRSAASYKSKQPEPLTLFIDRSLGKRFIADALRAAGADVRVHDDHFPVDAKDEEWLVEAGKHGWIVLTKDRRIRRRPLELTALRKSGVRAFVLSAGNLSGTEMAEVFVKALPKLRRFALKNAAPFVATITEKGAITKTG